MKSKKQEEAKKRRANSSANIRRLSSLLFDAEEPDEIAEDMVLYNKNKTTKTWGYGKKLI